MLKIAFPETCINKVIEAVFYSKITLIFFFLFLNNFFYFLMIF